MKLKVLQRVVCTLGFLLATAGTAAAQQAPVLTVTTNGAQVTIAWTAVPGATGYNLVVTGSINADVNLPGTGTSLVVNAPPGTYTLQVRGTAPGAATAFSNSVTITVGGSAPPPAPCVAPAAPTITTTVNGPTVTVNWTAVAGAQGYRVEFSRFSGGTELVVNATAAETSKSQYVPFLGTFFVRVTVGTCGGQATSAERPFTITTLEGSGPRTPNPAPGTLIPRASLGYAASVIASVAAQFDGDLQNSCHAHGGNHNFLFRVVARLRQIDTRWGTNEKRGNQGLSEDIITYNPTDRPDNNEQQIYLFDIIANHCPLSGRAAWNFQDQTDPTWAAGAQGLCSNRFCARWTIDDYLRAGFPFDGRQ